MTQCKNGFAYERDLARNLAAVVGHPDHRPYSFDAPERVFKYCDSIAAYFSVVATGLTQSSVYGYIQEFLSDGDEDPKVLANALVGLIDRVLSTHLSRAIGEVNRNYALLRSWLL